jgi:hypothetical protein
MVDFVYASSTTENAPQNDGVTFRALLSSVFHRAKIWHASSVRNLLAFSGFKANDAA